MLEQALDSNGLQRQYARVVYQALNPQRQTLNPKSQTLNPKDSVVQEFGSSCRARSFSEFENTTYHQARAAASATSCYWVWIDFLFHGQTCFDAGTADVQYMFMVLFNPEARLGTVLPPQVRPKPCALHLCVQFCCSDLRTVLEIYYFHMTFVRFFTERGGSSATHRTGTVICQHGSLLSYTRHELGACL